MGLWGTADVGWGQLGLQSTVDYLGNFADS